MATKAYIYVRMSTEQQSHGDSLPRQTERAEAFCRQHGLEIDQELNLQDIGVSAFTGANVESGALGRFLEAIKENKVPRGSYLLIESHDRLSRMEPARALPIFLEIQKAGISIAILADNRVFHPTGGSHFELIEAIIGMARSHDESRMKSDIMTGQIETELKPITPEEVRSYNRFRMEVVQDLLPNYEKLLPNTLCSTPFEGLSLIVPF